MIVVEGTDLVGKTTLARALVRMPASHWAATVNFSKLPDDWDHLEYYDTVNDRFVYDRWVWSTIAYDEVLGRVPATNAGVLHSLIQRYRSRAVYVCMIAAKHVLKARYAEIGDDMYKFDVIQSVNEWFQGHTSGFDIVVPVTGDLNIQEITTKIKNTYDAKTR